MKALEMRMRKLVLGLSLAQILPEKINKIHSSNNLGFIDVNRTVSVAQILPEKSNKMILLKKLGFIDLLSTVVLPFHLNMSKKQDYEHQENFKKLSDF